MVIMNKKGIFFTILVLLILTLFLTSYSFLSQSQDRKTTQKRVETMSNFMFSVEQDLSRQLFISGFRSVFLFNKYITENGVFLTDINSSFNEAFFNGTILGTTDAEIELLMNGATYSNITSAINEKAEKINVNITLENPILKIEQNDPWFVTVTLTTNLSMIDLGGLASWNRSQITIAQIPVEGFEDPVYFVKTGGQGANIITQTPYSDIASNIYDHSINQYYTHNTDAPSFLDRLQNINAPNENGIESFVNTPALPSANPSYSIIDHEFFYTHELGSSVSGQPIWIKLTSNHCTFYGVSC